MRLAITHENKAIVFLQSQDKNVSIRLKWTSFYSELCDLFTWYPGSRLNLQVPIILDPLCLIFDNNRRPNVRRYEN